ncbi:MAG: hypothetical protein OCC45_04560 [Desulfotalea sp.]
MRNIDLKLSVGVAKKGMGFGIIILLLLIVSLVSWHGIRGVANYFA